MKVEVIKYEYEGKKVKSIYDDESFLVNNEYFRQEFDDLSYQNLIREISGLTNKNIHMYVD